MRVLALDSSQIRASVCLIRDGHLEAARSGSVDVAHSEALLPHIDGLLRDQRLTVGDIDAFAVGVGPGSFTGIRIGCATVKGLAQVLSKPMIAFSSLRAMALSVGEGAAVVAMVNAYQGQVFFGWTAPDGSWHEDALSVRTWLERHGHELRSGTLFCGSGVKLYGHEVTALGAVLSELDHITAEGIVRAIKGSDARPYAELSANYLRPSQAEVKLASKLAK